MSTSSSAEEYEDQFCIVQFLGTTTELKSVDLVLRSWTFMNDTSLVCRYPPQKDQSKVRDWVRKQKSSRDNWPTYPIKILSTSVTFEQGERRLERSYTTANIESSEAEQQNKDRVGSHTIIKNTLSQIRSLTSSPTGILLGNKQLPHLNDNNDDILNIEKDLEEIMNDKKTDSSQNQAEDDSNVLLEQIKEVLKTELNKVKRSIIYDMNQKFNELKQAISEESAKKSTEDSPWKILDFKLPRESGEEFLELEASLATNKTKQNALKEIFHMLTIGSNNYIHDIQMIIKKLIRKEVQLLYSGTGRKTKGQGKKSFQDTESFKCLNDFLMQKYKDSKEKINVVTQISRYLAGAADRDGGKKERTMKN